MTSQLTCTVGKIFVYLTIVWTTDRFIVFLQRVQNFLKLKVDKHTLCVGFTVWNLPILFKSLAEWRSLVIISNRLRVKGVGNIHCGQLEWRHHCLVTRFDADGRLTVTHSWNAFLFPSRASGVLYIICVLFTDQTSQQIILMRLVLNVIFH